MSSSKQTQKNNNSSNVHTQQNETFYNIKLNKKQRTTDNQPLFK